ncbi:MAG: response regulator [Elusimicrobia bacterium]|nr:response regulator [Candidatus Obscuribacterium magneticum]
MPRVLIADDESELLELLRFSLDAAGFEVTTVTDGKKALDMANSQKFDLIILDVMMPHMDGYHVAQEISQDPKAPPVLLLTSRDFQQDKAAVKGSGATAFISKPFEIPELIDVAKRLVSKESIN